jgi:RimJ/RimL family protein N-acetyltransferase
LIRSLTDDWIPILEHYLRKDLVSNFIPLYQLMRTKPNDSRFYFSELDKELHGALVLYETKVPKVQSACLIGNDESASELLQKITFSIGLIKANTCMQDLINQRFEVKKTYSSDIMVLHRRNAHLFVNHDVRKLDQENAASWTILTHAADASRSLQLSQDEIEESRQFISNNICFGIFVDNSLVSRGAITMRLRNEAWAVGSIYTHPDYRGKGLATSMTSAVVRECLSKTDTVVLYVRSDNEFAVKTYRRLGFERKSSHMTFHIGTAEFY